MTALSETTVLDTRAVPPRDRPEYWSNGIARHFFPVQLSALGAPSFDARLVGGPAGPLSVGRIQGRAHRVVRTSPMILAGDPECVLLYLLVRGSVHLEQDERDCLMHAGDFACHDSSRPSVFEGRDAFDVVVFSMPRWFLGPAADRITRRTATTVSADDVRLGRLATPFLAGLAQAACDGGGLSLRDGENAAAMLLPLVSGMFESTEPQERTTPDLLERIKRYAAAHIHDRDLGPVRLAEAHFVSTRYVHKLFASSGTGVTEWIRDRRLEGALAQLQRSPDVGVSTVADQWGYRSATSFSRAFRTRYGRTPTELRTARRPETGPAPADHSAGPAGGWARDQECG